MVLHNTRQLRTWEMRTCGAPVTGSQNYKKKFFGLFAQIQSFAVCLVHRRNSIGDTPQDCWFLLILSNIGHNVKKYLKELQYLGWGGEGIKRRYFSTCKEPRNPFQGIDSASLCSLAGRYDNPIPTRFLVPIDCSKIPPQILVPFHLSHKQELEVELRFCLWLLFFKY
jgi:hypothetical protein